MPISENELMWSRSLPEEVEADPAEVVAGALTQPTSKANSEQPAAEAVAEAAGPEPVVRVEASGLEATLARLEMNSLAIKLHLEELEERIGRMQPSSREEAPAPQPMIAAITDAQPVTQPFKKEQPAGQSDADKPALSTDAKEKRWSHLIGPELEALMAVQAPTVAEAWTPSQRLPMQTEFAVSLTEKQRPPVAGAPVERAVEVPVVPAAERPMRMSAAAVRSGEDFVPPVAERLVAPLAPSEESAVVPLAAATTERRSAIPRLTQAAGRAPTATAPRPPESRLAADAARQIADLPGPAADLPRAVASQRREEPFPQRRMFASFEEPKVEERSPAFGPKMWRGYRVRRLVWAVVLLVLAAIPLAIWWRLSTEARDADVGDAASVTRLDPGAVALPQGKPSAGEVAMTAARRAPARGLNEAAANTLHGNAGAVRSGSAAAPVIRRPPSDAGNLASVPPLNSRALGGGRTSSGTASTALLGGQPGGADEVRGSSGLRVRVPEGVMAGRLLPTGDVGELPRGSGEVLATVYISNTGRVEEVEVVSGKEALRQAAARAIRNWRYEPYVQGGVRVPVVTTASIRFGGETAQAQ